MNWTSSTLNGGMGAEVEVILIWVSDILLDQGTWKGICIAVSSLRVALLREEADVVALSTDGNSPLDLFDVRDRLESGEWSSLHCWQPP